jgi:hypothetical protein|nr:MAG TPA: hypothetical protein [Myoviridae sp. ctTS62]
MQKIVNVHELDDGTLVCWLHPVTGKVYNFKIEYVDFNDDEQPAKLELIDNISEAEYIAVTPHIGFERKGSIRWPYASRVALSVLHDITESDVYMTLEDLFYPETAETTEEIEESDIPILFEGDLVKDAFGNTFEVVEAKPRQRLDPDRFDYCNMGYRLKLVTKNPTSPIREVHDNVKFLEEGNKYWVYNREEDARNVKEFNHTITASELVLSKSVFQVELRKTLESATPAKAESAKHRPSIQELRKLSEEYNPENLLDEAYQILEEQARLGERRANLTGKFKNCIQHFKREGFNVLEHGMLIEISW